MSLINGWANLIGGDVTAQFRLWQLLNEVEVIGNVTGGTITTGTAIATLPIAPLTVQPINISISNTSGAAQATTPRLDIQTNGNLTVELLPAGTVTFQFRGWFSLDA
jgi:hypothetical protein